MKINSVQYQGTRKTFVISDTKRENVFSEKVWMKCLSKTKQENRDVVVIKWKETGETICAAVEGFSLSQVLNLQPIRKHSSTMTTTKDSCDSSVDQWQKLLTDEFLQSLNQ